MSKKKLYKSRKNKMVGGVCGGLAEYLEMDPTIVRIIAIILGLLKGVGLLAYIVACIIIPFNEEDFSEDDTDNLKSANINPEDEKRSNSSAESDSRLHSDEDFDKFFKK